MRPKDPDSPTRAKITAAGEALMLTKGFGGTTVDEICSAASVTKGSFFHYFESKEALAKVLLENFAERQAALFFGPGAESAAHPIDRVYAVIDSMVAAAQDPATKGCLVGTLAQETVETHPELCTLCAQLLDGFVERIAALLSEARESEPGVSAFDSRELAEYLLALAQGSLLVLKATGDRQLLARNLGHFRRYLTQIFGR